jgi:hypothetical protein
MDWQLDFPCRKKTVKKYLAKTQGIISLRSGVFPRSSLDVKKRI